MPETLSQPASGVISTMEQGLSFLTGSERVVSGILFRGDLRGLRLAFFPELRINGKSGKAAG